MERDHISYFSKNCSIQCTNCTFMVITNPYDIANTFNNYFASTAETTKKKYSHKHFSGYLTNESLQPTDKDEIANIISSLNSNKASGPNSIPYRILPRTSGNLVVKSKLPPRSGSSLEAVEPHP